MKLTYQQADWLMNHCGEDSVEVGGEYDGGGNMVEHYRRTAPALFRCWKCGLDLPYSDKDITRADDICLDCSGRAAVMMLHEDCLRDVWRRGGSVRPHLQVKFEKERESE